MQSGLQRPGVENAYTIAPSLVEIGFEAEELKCAREYFEASSFSDALNWLEALVSSVSLVCAIEESISRISDLAMAVKKFAYDEKSPARELDVHDSLQSTLTILGHKLRIKELVVEKRFEAGQVNDQDARLGFEPGVDQPDRQRRGCVAGSRTNRDCDMD